MLEKAIPAIAWLKNYDKKNLLPDFMAGLVVAVMLVPQAMAYALLAGLPPVMGLYASTIPIIIYALFGSSRQLAVGPSAIIAILTLSAVSAASGENLSEYATLAVLLALMVGLIQSSLGFLRAGFITNFLSHAVISGFTSAAAIVIALSQLKHILGVKLEHTHSTIGFFAELSKHINESNLITAGIGIAGIALLLTFKKLMPKFPAAILVVIGSSLAVYFLQLNTMGVKIVADVPQGLPHFVLPIINLNSVKALLPAAFTIAFISFMESIAVASTFAAKDKYKLDANKELIGLGLANIFGAFFQAFPVAGGFGRSAVNYQAGAKTQLAALITAVLIIATLLFMTPLFYYLPNSALAAIVVVAVIGLIDFHELKHLWKLRRADAYSLLVAFFATLFIGVEQGIIIGVVFSLLTFIWRSAYPHTAELGLLESKNVFRNVNRYPEVKTHPDIFISRIDA
ncbi:MAG TPA: sulfate permease, partial [Trueperaceae bacterium]|nr:sulfate permease [Trueperaceae bacterium]